MTNIVAKWLRNKDERDPAEHYPELAMPLPPSVAAIPRPYQGAQPEASRVDPVALMRSATRLVEKYEEDRKAQDIREKNLQIQLTESLLQSEGYRKKIDFLEVENLELRNTIQVLEATNSDKTRTLEALRSALDSLGIQKRQRNGNSKRKEEAPCTESSQSSPLSSSPGALPPPPSLSTVTSAPTAVVTGPIASSTENDAGIAGTA